MMAASAALPCLGASSEGQPSEDDYFMYTYKVLPCPHSSGPEHCQEDCPYAHPAEKAARRDPRMHRYTGVSCPSYRKGACKDGDACLYAHGVFEVWLHPSRFRTELCKDGPSCTRKCCFFAHTPNQLRQAPPQDPSLPAPPSKAQVFSRASSGISRAASSSTTSSESSSSSRSVVQLSNSSSSSSPVRRPPVRSLTSAMTASRGAPPLPHSASFGSNLFAQAVPGLPAAAALGASSAHPFPLAVGEQGLSSSLGASTSMPRLVFDAGASISSQQHGMLQPHTAVGSGRLLSVPLDIALEAALLAAAASGTPDPQQQALLQMSANLEPSQLPVGLAALPPLSSPAAACPEGLAGLHAAAAAHHMLQLQQQEFATAVALQMALQAEQQKQQQQAQLAQQQQQQQQGQMYAMWTAAFNAARNVGLEAAEAATCADCAVKQTVANTPEPVGSAAGGCVGQQVCPQPTHGPSVLAALCTSTMTGGQVMTRDLLAASKLADSAADVLPGLLSTWGGFRL